MNQLCDDLYFLILQSLDVSSLYSLLFVSVRTQLTVQAYRLTHVGQPVSSVSCDAAEHGYVKLLGWLQMIDVNLQLTVQHMNFAANQGHQLMVEWLRHQGVLGTIGLVSLRLKMVISKCLSIFMTMIVHGTA